MSRSSHRDRSQRKTLPVIGKKIGDLESYVKPIKGSSSLNAPIDSFSRPPSYESESWAVPVQTMTQSDSDDQQDSSESESSKVDFGTVHHSLAKEKVEPTDKSSAMETMEYKFQQTRRKRQQVKKSSRLTPIATGLSGSKDSERAKSVDKETGQVIQTIKGIVDLKPAESIDEGLPEYSSMNSEQADSKLLSSTGSNNANTNKNSSSTTATTTTTTVTATSSSANNRQTSTLRPRRGRSGGGERRSSSDPFGCNQTSQSLSKTVTDHLKSRGSITVPYSGITISRGLASGYLRPSVVNLYGDYEPEEGLRGLVKRILDLSQPSANNLNHNHRHLHHYHRLR
ncbi:uncharacterized protein LOC112539802 [Tetranychus urticae]|uniref:uncharacterized protein LOC112539802 n=1 Tax=Tetranychus urticae TaxID=32264 RepID=UPI000D645E8B|nr:uncharacterized protein LOC112539802 [Tetranychus urticae]